MSWTGINWWNSAWSILKSSCCATYNLSSQSIYEIDDVIDSGGWSITHGWKQDFVLRSFRVLPTDRSLVEKFPFHGSKAFDCGAKAPLADYRVKRYDGSIAPVFKIDGTWNNSNLFAWNCWENGSSRIQVALMIIHKNVQTRSISLFFNFRPIGLSLTLTPVRVCGQGNLGRRLNIDHCSRGSGPASNALGKC